MSALAVQSAGLVKVIDKVLALKNKKKVHFDVSETFAPQNLSSLAEVVSKVMKTHLSKNSQPDEINHLFIESPVASSNGELISPLGALSTFDVADVIRRASIGDSKLISSAVSSSRKATSYAREALSGIGFKQGGMSGEPSLRSSSPSNSTNEAKGSMQLTVNHPAYNIDITTYNVTAAHSDISTMDSGLG